MGNAHSRQDSFQHNKKRIKELGSDVMEIDGGIADTFKENQMKEIKVSGTFSILLGRAFGTFFAFGSKCPHNGSSLCNGTFQDGLIRCPMHGACFDVRTGDIEEYPGVDGLPTFPVVRTEGGKLTVFIAKAALDTYRVERPVGNVSQGGKRRVVYLVVGGGAGALTAVQTLREHHFTGRIIVITNDNYLPYDRTMLSKIMGATWEDVALKSQEWYKLAHIEVILNAEVESVDTLTQVASIKGIHKTFKYEKILIATGLRPKVPVGLKAGGWKNLICLHSLRDSQTIVEKAVGKEVVIAGGGFVAMEIIHPLSMLAKKVTVIHRSKRPLQAVFGETVGRIVQRMISARYDSKVAFIEADEVAHLTGGNKEITKVVTTRGKSVSCGLLILALGGIPNTDCVLPYTPEYGYGPGFTIPPKLGIGMLRDRYLTVNKYMETELAHHFACGDIARFPLRLAPDCMVHCGHWAMAQKTGRVAALKMLDKKEETIFNAVPFFTTSIGGNKTFRYVGHGENFNHSLIYGDVPKMRLCVLYKRGWKLLAACTLNCDPLASQLSFAIQDDTCLPETPPAVAKFFKSPPVIGDTILGLRYFDDGFLTEVEDYKMKSKVEWDWTPRRLRSYRSHPPVIDLDMKLEFYLAWRQKFLTYRLRHENWKKVRKYY